MRVQSKYNYNHNTTCITDLFLRNVNLIPPFHISIRDHVALHVLEKMCLQKG